MWDEVFSKDVPYRFDEIPKEMGKEFRVRDVYFRRVCPNLMEVVIGDQRLWLVAGGEIDVHREGIPLEE